VGPACQLVSHHTPFADWVSGVALSVTHRYNGAGQPFSLSAVVSRCRLHAGKASAPPHSPLHHPPHRAHTMTTCRLLPPVFRQCLSEAHNCLSVVSRHLRHRVIRLPTASPLTIPCVGLRRQPPPRSPTSLIVVPLLGVGEPCGDLHLRQPSS
jgi:hypothetical protein